MNDLFVKYEKKKFFCTCFVFGLEPKFEKKTGSKIFFWRSNWLRKFLYEFFLHTLDFSYNSTWLCWICEKRTWLNLCCNLSSQFMLSWPRDWNYFSVYMLKNLLHQYMHCLIVHQLNQKTPEKTVNRMSLVVLVIECIKNIIVKKLGAYKDGQTVGCSFLPPKKFKPTAQSSWCTKHLHGINWRSGYKKYTELEKTMKNLEASEMVFFLHEVMENVRFCQNFWK